MFQVTLPKLQAWLPWRAQAPISAVAAERLRREQLIAVARQTPGMMFANACNALALMAAFWDSPRHVAMLYWLMCVLSLIGYIGLRHYRRVAADASAPCRSSAIRKAIFNAFALGSCWATMPLCLFQGASPGEQLLIACLCAGMLCGGAFALASIPAAAVAFTAPIVLASAASLAWSGGEDNLLTIGVLCVYAAALLRGVCGYASQLRSRTVKQVDTEEKVRRDSLTSLPNASWFNDAVQREFKHIARSGEGFALLYVDLDDFKRVNDRYGHFAGDELLVRAGERLRKRLRPSDFLARLGCDEFAILAKHMKGEEDAVEIARGVLECFEQPFKIDAGEVTCTASIGVAVAPRDGDNPHSLLRHGDIALYRAKQRGGLFCVFDPLHEANAREERALELDLRRALQSGQFELVYQPFLDIATGEISGCEALLRWVHPTRGRVSPALFIPIAERTGFIHSLGLWVIETACRAAVGLPAHIRVAVNVSAVQLRAPNFGQQVLDLLARAGLPPKRLEIEITETALLSDDQTTDSSLRKLAAAGVGISLDDFGVGYSSLSYLRKLPLDTVKIDQSFVRDVLEHPDCAAIVRGLISMAADLGIKTVGEGVEEASQLEWLRRNGCVVAQGFLISAPLSEAEFVRFSSDWRPEKIAA